MYALVWIDVATAVAGLLVAGGLVDITEGMVEERLQLTFQYANAAAAWYAVGALLCVLSPRREQNCVAALPATALLLTQSGGGLLVFALVAAILIVNRVRRGEKETLVLPSLQALVSVIGFMLMRNTEGIWSLLAIAALLVSCMLLWHMGDALESRTLSGIGMKRPRYVFLLAVAPIALVVASLLLTGRLVQASQSFVERLHQIKDGLSLWARSPLLGVGPDMWKYRFAEVQSSPYYVTVVHSSYVQVLDDAGAIALGLLLAALAIGMRNQSVAHGEHNASPWQAACLSAALFVTLHATIDFDLQFCSLAYLLVLLVTNGDNAFDMGVLGSRLPGVATLTATLLCVLGLMCEVSLGALSTANAAGDYSSTRSMYESNPFAQADPGAQEQYLISLNALGHPELTVAAYQKLSNPTDPSCCATSAALYVLGDDLAAGKLLTGWMTIRPYDVELYRMARDTVGAYGLDPTLVGRFNELIRRMNEKLGQGGSLLPGRSPIELYG